MKFRIPVKFIVLLLVFLVYLALSLLYFGKSVLESRLLAFADAEFEDYPVRLYYATNFLNHDGFNLWLPYEYLGLPILGILHSGVLYFFNFLYFVLPPHIAFNSIFILKFVLSSFFTFLLAQSIGVKLLPAFVAGLIYGYSGYLLGYVKAFTSFKDAAIWVPLCFFFYEKLSKTLDLKYALLASIIIGIQVFAGHYQVCIYTYLYLFVFVCCRGFEDNVKSKKRFFCLSMLPILLGSLIALPQIVATRELSHHALRSNITYGFFTEGSLNPVLLTLWVLPFLAELLPKSWPLAEITCSPVNPMAQLLTIVGIASLFRKDRSVFTFGLIAAIALILAFGKYNPFYYMTYHVPIYNLFRVPARHLLIYNLSVAILAGIAFNHLLYNSDFVAIRKGFIISATIILFSFVSVCLIRSLADPIFENLLDKNTMAHILRTTSISNYKVAVLVLCYAVFMAWFVTVLLDCKFHNIKSISFIKKITSWGLIPFVLALSGKAFDYIQPDFPKISSIKARFDNDLFVYIKDHFPLDRSVFLVRHAHLANVPSKVFTINGYDPLIISGVAELLDMHWWGTSSNWYGLVHNNLILSHLNARLIVIPKQDVGRYKIEEITAAEEAITPVDVSLSRWNNDNARPKGAEEYLLSSGDARLASGIRQTVSLRPNTYYLLSLEARSTGKQPTAPLAFDLYAPSYDFPEQELDVDAKEIGDEYRTFFRVINTGDNLPPTVDLRVFTFSKEPIIVRRIEVKELRNFAPPYIAGEDTPDKKGMPLYERVFETPEWVVYENKNCLPRAFSVTRLEVARDIKEVKRRFETLSVNPAETAFVSQEDLNKIGRTHFAKGNVRIDSYDTDRIVIKAEFANDVGFLVLSDQYFPGWKAFIDGKDVPIYQVNGLIRGVVVPEGTHKVEFVYRPVKLYISTVIGVTAFIACLVGACWIGSKKIN